MGLKEEKQTELYKKILDDTNQLIQISDCDTFSMLYANYPARAFAGHEQQNFQGEHCYKYMMGLDEKCPFCPMGDMNGQESYETEIDNGVQVFTVKTELIEWEGKKAFIEYATDITKAKRAQQIFEDQMRTLIQSIPEAQGIFHMNLTQDRCISANGVSHNVGKLKELKNVDSLFLGLADFIPDQKERTAFYFQFNRAALLHAYENGKTELVTELHSYYDDGSIRWARLTARMIMNPDTGDLECIFYGMDNNEEKSYLEQMTLVQKEKDALIEKSKLDMLTGVYSKRAFEQLAYEYIHMFPMQEFAVIFLDLDHFKNVNDTLGHLMGDQAIIDAAERLQTIFSNKDVISRFGGDEFCILVKNIPQSTLIRKLDFILKELRRTYQYDEKSVDISASMGVAFGRGMEKDIMQIVQVADQALYQAKRNGRNQYCIRNI